MKFTDYSPILNRSYFLRVVLSVVLIFCVWGKVWSGDDNLILSECPTTPKNHQYVGNRSPLQASRLITLPSGTVSPKGWLKQMLLMQAAGFHGHLQEISDFLKPADNAWLSKTGKGKRGWEEVPYWLKGYLNCAYALHDEAMIREAHRWVKAAMDSQQQDGWFGPGEGRTGEATDLVGRDDLWPNMVMLFILQDYYEKTGDKRVFELMTRYFRYLEKLPEERFLIGYWPSMRGGDQLYSILWLYNRTGQSWLLDLAKKTHRKTARWDKGLINLHNVNVAQAFREPAVYSLLSLDSKDLQATEQVYQKIRKVWGQVPGGMFGADENAREGFTGPRQMIETCGIVEEMLSDELLIAITGNPSWAERCENVTFNSLPAAFSPDMRGLRYLTGPNMPQSDHRNKAPGIQNGGDMLGMNPHWHRCCQHNSGHGWPYFNNHLWYATAGDGLAAFLYAPCQVTAKVAGGQLVTIDEETHYPFEEKIQFVLTLKNSVEFPLLFRIPEWCHRPSISINGKKVQDWHGATSNPNLVAGKIVSLKRLWQNGDKIELEFPMETSIKKWESNQTVSINHGPLTYSLLIKEKYVRYAGTDLWPAYDIFPDSSWNYGLQLDDMGKGSNLGISFEAGKWPEDDRPFTQNCPVKMHVKGRKILNWKLDRNGLVQEVIAGPIHSNEPLEPLTLIPMGAARLRISAFPIIDNGSAGKDWPESPKYVTKSSHCWSIDTEDALCDGILPKNSNDPIIPRFTYWPHQGTKEWVEYQFKEEKTINSCSVYWFDDSKTGGGCKLPQSWKISYLDGKVWKSVHAKDVYTIQANQFCKVRFDPIKSSAIRLEIQLQPKSSAGILEWEISSPVPKQDIKAK